LTSSSINSPGPCFLQVALINAISIPGAKAWNLSWHHTGCVQILEQGTGGNANGKLDQKSEVEATYTLGSDVITDNVLISAQIVWAAPAW
jgi:hypothetical protein